jgi:enoyl-CoA hydratase/carnithine racemase
VFSLIGPRGVTHSWLRNRDVPPPHTRFEIDASVATLTFNRPDARNAMTWAMYDALVDACDAVDADEAVRVFVLRGAGGQAFVSGTDISQFATLTTRDKVLAYERRLDRVFDRLERVKKPTIARVEGAATGGGCVIALACDFRLCTPEARFGVPIARTLGNCLSAANCARLVDVIGPARARELLLTGRLVGAAEAEGLGLATRIVAADAMDAEIRALSDLLAANAPLTIRAGKETVRRIQEARRSHTPSADDLVAACYLSDDFREGVAAFLAKRAPRFTGH